VISAVLPLYALSAWRVVAIAVLIDTTIRPIVLPRAISGTGPAGRQSAGLVTRGQIMNDVSAMIPTQAMKIEKVKEHIGAIVTGIDLAQPIDAATQKKLYDAVVETWSS
jgi:hypothetical protein